MKSITSLTALAVVSLALGAPAVLPVALPLPKTNNVMALNFTLTAWPNATATPRANALRSAAAQFSSAPAPGILFMPIIGLTNDGTPIDDPLGWNPIDPLVDLPPDIIDVPVDGGITDGSGDVPPDGIFYIMGASAAAKPKILAVVSSAPVSITSKDIIAALNGNTNNGVALHFSGGAKLLFKQTLNPRTLTVNTFGTNRLVVVREIVSGRNVDTDVSKFFGGGVNYLSTRTVNGEVRQHELASLSLINPGKLGLQLSALLTELSAPPATNGVAALRSLRWEAHGSGQVSGGTPNLVISGVISTGATKLE